LVDVGEEAPDFTLPSDSEDSVPLRDFTAYRVDDVNVNLQTIFRAPWLARSKYEDKERPTYGHYCSLVHDRLKNRILLYLSAVDPRPETKKQGWTEVCVRQLVYECPL